MAKSVLDIIIKLSKQGGADRETVKGLVQVKSAIMGAAAVAGTLVAAGYTVKKVFDETVGTLINYAEQVRRVENATGATAEDASKLIQILDDQKISYEQLEKAIQKSGKAYDFSIKGIANMSEEFLKLGDVNKEAAFMQDRFGKQWISFIPIMQQGKQAILDSANAVDEGLVLTEKAIVATRRWEIQMDNFNDKVQATKIELGQGFLGLLDGSTVAITKNAQAIYKAANGYEFNVDRQRQYTDAQRASWEEAKKQAEAEWIKTNSLDASTAATQDATPAAEDYAEALKAISEAHTSMLGLIGKVASEEQSYQQTAKDLNNERIQIEGERAAAIAAGWWEGSQKIQEFDAALAENGQKAQENADKHHEAMGRIQYDLLITKLSVDGLTDAEFLVAQQAGLTFGVFDQESIEAAKNMDLVANAVLNGTLKVQEMRAALDMMKKGYNINVVLNVLSSFSEMGTSANAKVAKRHGGEQLASGTEGWKTVPTGFPNDTYPISLSSGEQYAVIPNGGGGQSTMAGGGGGNVYVTLTIASPLTIMDQQHAQNTLLPYIIDGIRQAKAQGAIK